MDFASSPRPFKLPPIKVDSGDEQWVRDELAKQDALGAFGPAVASDFISPAPFHHLRLHPTHVKYFNFHVRVGEEVLTRSCFVLPFGWRCSPVTWAQFVCL